MSAELFEKLIASIVDCDPDTAEELTRRGLTEGIEPLVIIHQGLMKGMQIVGDRFHSNLVQYI